MKKSSAASVRFTLPSIIFAAVLVVATYGCSASRSTAVGDPATALQAIMQGYAATPELTLEGTVQAAGMPVTVWFDALIRRRDSLKVVLTGPFGIPVGALAATPQAFVYLNADPAEAVEGIPDRKTFGALLTIPLDYEELVALLRGEVPHLPRPGEYRARTDGALYVLTADRGDRVEELTIDPAIPAVVRYVRSATSGAQSRSELDITYSDFITLEGRALPARARAAVADGTQTISVTVSSAVAAIDGDASLTVTVPPGIPRRRP